MPIEFENVVHYRIANAPLRPYPFPHQYVSTVFPDDFYRQLRAHLPPIGAYQPIAETGTVSRKDAYRERMIVDVADLAADEPEGADGFWSRFAAWMLGERFNNLLLACYRPMIQARFGREATITTRPQARLVRDLTNYALGPHTDMPEKLLSLLFYLPADDAMPHLGTAVYEPKEPAFRCKGGPHYRFENFRQLQVMPYVPNALFVIFKTDTAFHGVEPVREANVQRDILQFNVYVESLAQPPKRAAAKVWSAR